MLVLFVLGTWNPADLVVLWRFAGNPFIGALIVFALALVASWLLAPIGSEARQITRARVRIVLTLALVASLLGYLLVGPVFKVDYDVLAQGRVAGDRALQPGHRLPAPARLDRFRDRPQVRRRPGQAVRIHDCHHDQLGSDPGEDLRTPRRLRLDPATGRPLDRLGPTAPGEAGRLDPVTTPEKGRELLTEERTEERTDYRYDEGDHEKFAHYAPKEQIMQALVEGTPVRALCGKPGSPRATPSASPSARSARTCTTTWSRRTDLN